MDTKISSKFVDIGLRRCLKAVMFQNTTRRQASYGGVRLARVTVAHEGANE